MLLSSRLTCFYEMQDSAHKSVLADRTKSRCKNIKNQPNSLPHLYSSLPSFQRIFVFIGLFLIPFVSSLSFVDRSQNSIDQSVMTYQGEDNFEESIKKMTGHLEMNKETTKKAATEISIYSTLSNNPLRSRLRRSSRKRRSNCPKHLRDNFCMNKGRCRWIADLGQASCRCPTIWIGDRCQKPLLSILDVSNNKPTDQDNLPVATILVLSAFGLIFFFVFLFFCCRRYRSIKNQLQLDVKERMKQQENLIEKRSNISLSTTSSL